MLMPLPLMRAIFVLIGISLGAVVTPATLHGMATYPLSIAVLLIVAMACVSVAGAAYLRLVHGWDMLSAYLAAAPGGLSQVMGLAAELGADLRAIAIVQTHARRHHRRRLAGRAVAARACRPCRAQPAARR